MREKLLLFFSILVSVFFLSLVRVSAEEQPYSVTPVLPKNQDNGITNYISISTNDDSLKQEIQFNIMNNTNERIDLKIKPTNALTSPNGIIQYVPTIEETNAKLVDENYSLNQYITVEENISLNGGESKTLSALIDISDIGGTILGAIAFQSTNEGEIQDQKNQQFKVNNEINTIIGVQINFETDEKPNFKFGLPRVEPLPTYYVLRLPITYDTPLLLQNASLNYEILNSDGDSLFKSSDNKSLNFAPKTDTNLSIPWEHTEIKTGETYTIKGALTYNDENIGFEKEFEFNPKEGTIKEPNKIQIPTIHNDSPLWWLIAGITIVLVVGAFIIILYRKKQTKKSINEVEEKIE